MKRFQFSLSRMLSYKEQIQQAEKNKLAQCNQRRHEIEEKIDSLKAESEKIAAELTQAQKIGASIRELNTFSFKLENTRLYLEQLAEDLLAAIAEVERQLAVVLAATQEVEGLLKLKEKQYEEFLYEENKAEQLVVSEFVSAKLIRDGKKAEEEAVATAKKQAN